MPQHDRCRLCPEKNRFVVDGMLAYITNLHIISTELSSFMTIKNMI